ncbi:MAG: rRNA maturation RNase YbeY [Chloroflexi bacterium]|nr:rRNA maturation RNase YbeY [Chloroflexota bacterium]
MTKYIVNIQVKKGLDFPYKKGDLKRVIATALQIAKVPGPVEVDCVITNNTTIHRLNKLYRGIDSPTDVLSFGLSDRQPVSDTVAFPVAPGEVLSLGEIIISYERTVEQAAAHDNTVEQELNLLMVHGTLHLLGHDHEDNADARKMRAWEKKILKCL